MKDLVIGQSAGGSTEHVHRPTAACRPPTCFQRAPRRIVNSSFRSPVSWKHCKKSSCVGVRPAETRKRNGQHGRSDFVVKRLASLHATFRTPTHRVSSPSRRGCCVVRSINARCPICLRSTGPPFGHGFVGTGDSRIDVRNRIGYRPVDTATGRPCFARKHDPPLAS